MDTLHAERWALWLLTLQPNIGNGKQIATFICPDDGIDVVINPGIDKVAKVAVMGAEDVPGCYTYVRGPMYHLKINVTNANAPPCGIQRDADGTMTVRVASQAFMNAYGGSDRVYTIQCKLGQKLTARTSGTVIQGTPLWGSNVDAPLRGFPVVTPSHRGRLEQSSRLRRASGNLQSGMAFQQDATMVKLEIRDLAGVNKLSQAGLGEMVVLHAELMNTAVYKGMDVNRCTAYDSIDKTGAFMMLLENGCGTGDVIGFGKGFYNLPDFADNVLVSTPLPMFRFLKSAFIMVECEFNRLCTMEDKATCNQSCKSGGVARRRRSDTSAPNSTVTTFMVLPESHTPHSVYDYLEPDSRCVEQLAVIVAVGILGSLVILTTAAAIWFCTRWSQLRKQESK